MRSPRQVLGRRGVGAPPRSSSLRVDEKASAGGALLGLFGAGQPAYTPRQYDRLADEAYAKNVIAYLCVKLIADGIASLKFDLFKDDKEIEEHPMLDLLRKQNPVSKGPRWWRELASYNLLAGNAYIEAVGTGEGGESGPPKELWNMRPDRMRVIPGQLGTPMAYRYELNGQHRDFPVDPIDGSSAILHLKDFHPLNDWYGFGPVEAAARWIDVDNAASDMNLGLLQGGGMPAGLAMLKGNMDAPTVKRMEAQIRQMLQNTVNRVLVVSGDWDFKELSRSLQDMQWSEGMLESARRICAGWNVPYILVIPGESTFNNREQARLELWEHTILPFADMLLGDVSPWLGRMFGNENLELRVDKLEIPALEARRLVARKEAREDFKAGLITKDEARRESFYGDAEDESGGEYFKPPAMVGLAAQAQLAADQGQGKPPAGQPPSLRPPAGTGKPPAGGRPGKGDGPFDEPTIDALPVEYQALIAALDEDVILEEVRPVVLGIVRHFGQRALDEVVDRQLSEPGGANKRILQAVFNITQPLVQGFMASFAGDVIRGLVDATTRRRLGEAMAKVIEEGATFPKLVRAIMDTFEDADRTRAVVIARTEATRAAGAGTQAAIIQADVKWKGWLSTRDDWVRDTHQRLDGQVKPADKPFVIDGHEAMHPGGFEEPGLTINCRCIEMALPDQRAVDDFAASKKRDAEWHARAAELAQLEAELQTALKLGFQRQGQRLLAVLNERFR